MAERVGRGRGRRDPGGGRPAGNHRGDRFDRQVSPLRTGHGERCRKSCFAAAASWPAALYIVRKHFFAMDVSAEAEALELSAEHKEFGWFSYEEAYAALRYDDDKTALWELGQRITRQDLPLATG